MSPPGRLTAADWHLYLESDALAAESAVDPETEPYRSRYAAVDKLAVLAGNVDAALATGGGGDLAYELRAAKALVLLKSSAHHAATDERPRALQSCAAALAALDVDDTVLAGSIVEAEFALLPVAIGVLLRVLNQLGYIHECWEDHTKAKYWLKLAEDAYSCYKIKYADEPPLTANALMRRVCAVDEDADDTAERRWSALESAHTRTVYYLAQVYQNGGEKTLAANYCGRTLVRQLEADEYEATEWALNAAMLGQYYTDQATLRNGNFQNARHCLAAATAILDGSDAPAPSIDSCDDDAEAEREKRGRAAADLARCWLHYSLALLTHSRDAQYAPDTAAEPETAAELEPTLDAGIADIAPLFPALQLHRLEAEVPSDRLADFDSARRLFLRGQRAVERAKAFYALHTHCTDHVALLQNQSQLYKLLAAFERHTDRRCKMHKRRIDMLSGVLKELSPTIYQQLCRQLLFEIGETYSEMVTLKLEAIEETGGGAESASGQQADKINTLAINGISHFKQFVETYARRDGTQPTKYAGDSVRPVALCHFYMGRLAGKLVAGGREATVRALHTSLAEYRWIVDYFEERDADSLPCCRSEYDVCKEMVALLPVRIQSLQSL